MKLKIMHGIPVLMPKKVNLFTGNIIIPDEKIINLHKTIKSYKTTWKPIYSLDWRVKLNKFASLIEVNDSYMIFKLNDKVNLNVYLEDNKLQLEANLPVYILKAILKYILI